MNINVEKTPEGRKSQIELYHQITKLFKDGLSEKEVSKKIELSISQLRKLRILVKEYIREEKVRLATALKNRGFTNVAIAKEMNLNESTIRSLLDVTTTPKLTIAEISDILKRNIIKSKYVDVSIGSEKILEVSRTKLNSAVIELIDQGYNVFCIKTEQIDKFNRFSIIKVLCGPDNSFNDVKKNKDLIKPLNNMRGF